MCDMTRLYVYMNDFCVMRDMTQEYNVCDMTQEHNICDITHSFDMYIYICI